MRLAWLALLPVLAASSVRADERVPVLVELFTSEGCSSCPPADDVLRKLAETQPVAGVEVVALGEHVDYWDSLGWRDPFSARENTDRQERYASLRRDGRIYTPQAVVGGRAAVIGSDERELVRALESARAEPHGTVALRDQSRDAAGIVVTCAVALPAAHPLADVTLAIVEDGLVSKVERGENAGRTLHHSAVVRRVVDLGTAQGASFSAKPHVVLDRAWRPEALRLVAFVQERQTGHILAAASAPITQVPPAAVHSH